MSLSQFFAASLITFAAVSAQAQKRDSTLARLRDAPLAGSARIAISAAYRPVAGVWEAAASSTFAPFINENWQLGIQPFFDVLKEPVATHYSGTVGLLANYLFRQGNVSRPYVGVFLSGSGATGSSATRSLGVQAGWLRFVTPSIAFRTELSFRRFSGVFLDEDFTELTLTLDPYLFGRASDRLTTLPGRGAVDVTGSLRLQITPNHDGLLQVMVAPFLAQWFQPGLSIIYSGSSSDPNLEVFGRGYLRTRWRSLLPDARRRARRGLGVAQPGRRQPQRFHAIGTAHAACVADYAVRLAMRTAVASTALKAPGP